MTQRNPQAAKEAAKIANSQFKAGSFDDAIAGYKEATQLDPLNSKYLDKLGQVLYRSGRFAEAVDSFEKSAKINGGLSSSETLLQAARAAANGRSGAPTTARKVGAQNINDEVKNINILLKSKDWFSARAAINNLIDQADLNVGSYIVAKNDVVVANIEHLGADGTIKIDREILWETGNVIRKNPIELLNLPSLRSRLSRQRRLQFLEEGRMKLIDENDNIIKNAVVHNVEKLDESRDDGARPNLLVNPLSSIDYIATHKSGMKILTIGSRSESELFCLYAAGFNPSNIEAVDLISYTPLIRSGDAHKLEFPDSTFDIIVAGWVLAYSQNPQLMADEIMRVSKPHAYVAAGCAYTPPGRGKGSTSGTNISGTRFSSIEDITRLFEKRMARVLFQSPIERERIHGTAALATVVQLGE